MNSETKKFYQVWFSTGSESTGKLVVDTEAFPQRQTTVATFSKLFPHTESGQMKLLCMSSTFDTFTEAFHQRSKAMDLCLRTEDQFYRYDSEGRIIGTSK